MATSLKILIALGLWVFLFKTMNDASLNKLLALSP